MFCLQDRGVKMRNTKEIKIGAIKIGANNAIAVQSMLNTKSFDVEGGVLQAKALKKAGCDILRVAIPTLSDVVLIESIKNEVDIPLVADIHFDYRIALEAIEAGIDKIRINPGNIGDDEKVKMVAKACNTKNIPIRIGVNSGSLEKEILAKYGSATPQALVESAMYHISLLEKYNFNNIVVSLKSSDPKCTVDSYRLISQKCDYPLHLGVTEAGTKKLGVLKSAAAIGSLLLDGIGDTIRVSLTDDPIEEIYAANDILKSIGKKDGVKLISCPTCGRTRIDLIGLAKKVENALSNYAKNITVAVMGCVVNGPGEAKEADIGVAGGDGCAIIFKKGEIVRKVSENEILSVLLEEIEKM